MAARAAAVVMVACAVVHATGAVQHWSPGLSLLTIGVADWVWVTVGSAAMLGLHLVMLAAPAAASGHAHLTAATGPPMDPLTDSLTVLGLVLPVVGLALAWWAIGSLGVGIPVDDHRPDRRRDG